jgi:hypothetical protein
MSRYTINEVRRALLSLPFVLAVLVGTIAGLSQALPAVQGGAPDMGAYYVFSRFHSSVISLLAPILATLPFAQSYAAERNSGFSQAVLQRMSQVGYSTRKLLVAAASGGLALAVPVGGALVWSLSAYPLVPDPDNPLPLLFGHVHAGSQLQYMLFATALTFLFGATFAVVGMASSVLFRNPFYAHVVPMVLYIVPAFVTGSLGLGFMDPPMMWDPSGNIGTTPLTIATQYAVFLVVAVAVFNRFLRLREE